MSTEKKKEQQLLEDVTAQPAVQSSYSTAGLNSRKEVENALTNAVYTPGQSVTDAAADLRNWQQNRPGKYESAYQGRIEDLIGQLLERNSFQYSYAQDPLYRQYAQQYTQNARNASADAAAQAAALTGGYGSSYAASVAQQAYQQQMGALNDALPSLYRLALDTYNSEGDDVVTRIDQLNTQEQNAQAQYNAELSDYYSQLDRKGSAYNAAYEQDYGRYQDYLGRLDTLYGYYSNQEQQAIAKRKQAFNGVLSILGVIGDAVQLAITGPPASARWWVRWPTPGIICMPKTAPTRPSVPTLRGTGRCRRPSGRTALPSRSTRTSRRSGSIRTPCASRSSTTMRPAKS